jgi:hypothetical protein
MSTRSIEYQKFRARMGMDEATNNPPPEPPKVVWTYRDVMVVVGVVLWVLASIWVGSGNPKEGFFYAMFWGGVIAFMTIVTLAGCFARIWLAYHSAEIAENIYRGLCSRK